MNLKNQLVKPTQDSEYFFYVDSGKLAKNIEYIKSNEIKNIYLIPRPGGYNLKHVDWFKEVPFLKKINMAACTNIIDYSGLSSLLSLVELSFTADKGQAVDLSNLIKLKGLFLMINKKVTGIDKLINLEQLHVNKGDSDFYNINIFQNFNNLEILKIMQAQLPASLGFLKKNSNLKDLEFTHCKSLIDLKDLIFLKDNLEKLRIVSSTKIANVDTISKLKKLKWLILSESVPLKGAEVVENLPHLEVLSLYGSSYFENGDLRSLKGKFESMNIGNKRHYFFD